LLQSILPSEFHRGATVSLVKRVSILSGLALAVVAATSSSSEAQIYRGHAVVVHGGFGYGGFYYAHPFWYGYPWYPYPYYYPSFYYQYPWGYPYGYGYRIAPPDSALRLEITPKQAEVYIDGYYAGIVDDFDGTFQRLRVAPGQHELTLYYEGYKTVHQQLNLTADSTFKVKYTMEKLAAGAAAEPRPAPSQPPPGAAPVSGGANGPEGPAPRPPTTRRAPLPPPPPGGPGPGPVSTSAYGTLAVRVQPANATVIVDGERWEGPQGPERLTVELAEGQHRVQIQHDGYESYSSDVTIRRGETTPLNVSLRTH
jgi:hypothetical protein